MTKKTATTTFIHSYNAGSAGAKALAKGLSAKRILTGGRSNYKHSKAKTVINWGSSEYHVDSSVPMINPPEKVHTAANKLSFFEALNGTTSRLVPFTSSVEEAQGWIDEGCLVVAREKLTGHSGEGIVLCEGEIGDTKARLFTKYVKKAREYRVHVMNGEVIRVQRKILSPDLTKRIEDTSDSFTKDDVNWFVRNHGNGFIYITGGVEDECPVDVLSQAKKAVRNCGLDFGAVDLIWNNKKQQSFVLEINTSPGLEGETIEAYVEGFKGFLKDGRKVTAEAVNQYSDIIPSILDRYNFTEDRLLAIKRWSVDKPEPVISCFTWGEMESLIRKLHATSLDFNAYYDRVGSAGNRRRCEEFMAALQDYLV